MLRFFALRAFDWGLIDEVLELRGNSQCRSFLSLSSGGGFGGKETRNCFLSSVVAVAAAK